MEVLKPFVLCLVMAAGCSAPQPVGGDFAPRYYDVQQRDGTFSETTSGKGDFHAGGWWVLMKANNECVIIPGVKKAFDMYHYSINVGLMTVREDGRTLHMDYNTCYMADTPVLNLAPTYSKHLLDTAENPWHVDGVITGTRAGATYVQGPRVENWGIHFDPFKEDFPTDPADSRIWDQDHDGHPGVTVVTGNNFCTVYIAQSSVTQLLGELKGPLRIRGAILPMVLEKITIDATDPFCKIKHQEIDNPDYTFFEMLRVDGKYGAVDLDADHDGKVTCNEVMPSWKQLFPTLSVDDKWCEWVTAGKD